MSSMIPIEMYSAAYSRASDWLPTDVSNLAGWWDADDASTFTFATGSVISQWNDKSGNNRHFSQATSTKRPSRVMSAQNGLAVVRFDGTSDVLKTTSFNLSQPFSIIMAGKITTPGFLDDRAIICDSTSGFDIYMDDSNSVRVYAGQDKYAFEFGNGIHTYSFTVNGSLSSWLDGSGGSSVYVDVNGISGGLSISNETYSEFFDEDIYELMLYSKVLNTAERQAAELYLKNKWATP